MFGIPGLDPFGAVHAALGLAAIVLRTQLPFGCRGRCRRERIE